MVDMKLHLINICDNAIIYIILYIFNYSSYKLFINLINRL